jgi:hypothetical protein
MTEPERQSKRITHAEDPLSFALRKRQELDALLENPDLPHDQRALAEGKKMLYHGIAVGIRHMRGFRGNLSLHELMRMDAVDREARAPEGQRSQS